jgi:hypothetical protein
VACKDPPDEAPGQGDDNRDTEDARISGRSECVAGRLRGPAPRSGSDGVPGSPVAVTERMNRTMRQLNATVRFYRRRAKEPPWISADLERYDDEAVLLGRMTAAFACLGAPRRHYRVCLEN